MTKPLYERRFNAISAAITAALHQDGWNMDKKTTSDVADALALMPETFNNPARTLLEMARTLQKAARYADTNTKDTPRSRPANAAVAMGYGG